MQVIYDKINEFNINEYQNKELVIVEHYKQKWFYYFPNKSFIISNQIYNSIFNTSDRIITNNLKSIITFPTIWKNIKNNDNWKIIDINGLVYSNDQEDNISNYISLTDKYKNFINSRYDNKNINIPLPILYEEMRNRFGIYYKKYKDNKNYIKSNEYLAYILRSMAFSILERNGMSINKKALNKLFDKINPSKKLRKNNKFNKLLKFYQNPSNIINPQWNIHTSVTGRAQGNYKGINLINIERNSIFRKMFNSRFDNNGIIYSFDYDGFHPRIVSYLINEEIPLDKSAHEYIAEKYYPRKNKYSYDDIKRNTFVLLYGGTKKQNNPFYNKIRDLYNKNKIITFKTNLGRKINTSIPNRKRLNYFIQKYETDLITMDILKISKLLQNYKTCIFYYQYDSIGIDVYKPELEDGIINKIKDIMENIEKNKKFKVDISKGQNLKEINYE